MTHRENLLRTLSRSGPQWVPYELGMTPGVYETFKQKTGQTDPSEYFRLGFRHIGAGPSRQKLDHSRYFAGLTLPPGTQIDEWGVARRPGSMYHFEKMIHPMRDLDSVDQVASYPLPDLDADYRYDGIAGQASKHHDAGYAVIGWAGHIFETSWYMRGLDNLLTDMAIRPKLAEAVLERVVRLDEKMAHEVAAAGADVISTGDDVGTQRGMMMSPSMWREFIKPRLARVCRAAKNANPNVRVYYHSDGNVMTIVPDLLEAGVDILDPVQPECMDLGQLVKDYGDCLLYWGTLGTQTTMPFGRPQDVKAAVRRAVETVGRGGGLVIAPTHVLEPDVPWENIMALAEVMGELGHP